MSMVKDMKTRSKLLTSFIILAVISILIGIVSISRFYEMSGMLHSMYDDRLVPLIDLGKVNDHLAKLRINALRIISEPESSKRQEISNAADENMKEIDKLIEKYGATYLVPDEKKTFEEFKPAWKAYNESRSRTYALALNGRTEEAKENARTDAAAKYKTVDEKLNRLVTIQDEVGKELYKEAQSDARLATYIIVGGTIIIVVLAIFFGFIMSSIIATPLQIGVRLAEAIADGDLSQSMREDDLRRKDEVGQLLNAMLHMTNKLKTLMSDIRSASDTIASASNQLSASAEQLSGGVADQAGRTSQIATASTEMSQTVVDIAKNTSNIATSASETVKTAKAGEDIVDRSVREVKAIAETVNESASLMSSLGERSRQIGEIIGVIKDIADQTNLLALNAAIEAARAGEQGRGFAVVADEVRKLAERTTKATSEIGGMITAIQEEVQKAVNSMDEGTKRVHVGVEFSTKTGDALRGIVDSVNELQSMVQQIATATDEMSSVADQISGDIEAVALVSNETSASSNQISQASNDLSKLSSNLALIVGKFKV